MSIEHGRVLSKEVAERLLQQAGTQVYFLSVYASFDSRCLSIRKSRCLLVFNVYICLFSYMQITKPQKINLSENQIQSIDPAALRAIGVTAIKVMCVSRAIPHQL